MAEEEHVQYQRCSKQLGTSRNEPERSSRNLFHNKKRKTSGLTHGDDFVVTGTKDESVGVQEAAVQSKRASSGQVRQKSIKALNRRMWLGQTVILYQHEDRHVDVLVESLGLENGNTVQTPIIGDVKDEIPVWLDSEQISKYTSHLARRSFTTQLFQIEATRSVLEGRNALDSNLQFRGHEFRSYSFSLIQTGQETKKLGNRQVRELRSWDDTF